MTEGVDPLDRNLAALRLAVARPVPRAIATTRTDATVGEVGEPSSPVGEQDPVTALDARPSGWFARLFRFGGR